MSSPIVTGCGLPPILSPPEVARCWETQDQPCCVIGGGVINYYQLDVAVGLCENAMDGLLQVTSNPIIGWDDGADSWHLGVARDRAKETRETASHHSKRDSIWCTSGDPRSQRILESKTH